jgi:large subunit ribosomal protein L18
MFLIMSVKDRKRYRRHRIKMRIRKIVRGTGERPRMCVFRSNREIYVQLIDDTRGMTLLSTSTRVPEIEEQKVPKVDKARLVGKAIAAKALEAGISTVVFDRNGYLYHGRVKSLAEAAREAGLKF